MSYNSTEWVDLAREHTNTHTTLDFSTTSVFASDVIVYLCTTNCFFHIIFFHFISFHMHCSVSALLYLCCMEIAIFILTSHLFRRWCCSSERVNCMQFTIVGNFIFTYVFFVCIFIHSLSIYNSHSHSAICLAFAHFENFADINATRHSYNKYGVLMPTPVYLSIVFLIFFHVHSAVHSTHRHTHIHYMPVDIIYYLFG